MRRRCEGRGRAARTLSSTRRVSRQMAFKTIKVPSNGEKITMGSDGKLRVPDRPIIPFIEGDGTGPDIWRASVRVLDAAVRRAHGDKRRIHWMEVFAGEKANRL